MEVTRKSHGGWLTRNQLACLRRREQQGVASEILRLSLHEVSVAPQNNPLGDSCPRRADEHYEHEGDSQPQPLLLYRVHNSSLLTDAKP